MSFLSPLLVVVLLQRMTGGMAMGCDVDGDIRLDFTQNGETDNQMREFRLVQVCLFGEWSYVCNWGFDYQDVDNNVLLQQLQCQNGETKARGSTSSITPAYLTRVDCVGVEKRLIDCPRDNSLGYIDCPNKVQVNCSDSNTDSPFANRECDIGQLHISNTTSILYICVNGNWRTLCPNLWGPAQATVACRQLNPGRTVIRSVVNSTTTAMANQFKYHFFCTGKEKEITDCSLSDRVVNNNLCNGNMVATLLCDTGSVSSPTQLTLRAVSSSSVEANWTQPVSVLSQYRVSNHSITCTSSHGVYTTTSQHESTHIHMIISGLMSNTSYNCCVSAHSELGTSESVCDTVITTEIKVQPPEYVVLTVVQSCTADVRATPHIVKEPVHSCTVHGTPSCQPTSAGTDSQSTTATSSLLPWVGGVIIGAVLSTVILITVLAAVCLLRRKRIHSQHKLSDQKLSTKELNGSINQINEIYSGYSDTPQHYEVCQTSQSATEPEYSYTTHAVATNMYDSVPQQSSEDDGCYGNTEGLTVIDNTALYSAACEDGEYSKLSRKYQCSLLPHFHGWSNQWS